MLTVQPRSEAVARESARRRAADPAAEMAASDNRKHRKELTELLLTGRGIEKLDGAEMGTFPNLAVLWLSDNKLSKLKGLDGNPRLTALYLDNNRIASLAAPSCSLPHLRSLETLLLHNNAINDLDRTLGALERLSRLRILNLFGNPVAEETNYRPITVHRLRALEILDRHAVAPTERTAAAKLFDTARIVRKMAFGQRIEPWGRPVPQALHSFSVTERWIIDENVRVRARRRARAAREEHESLNGASLPTFQYAYTTSGAAPAPAHGGGGAHLARPTTALPNAAAAATAAHAGARSSPAQPPASTPGLPPLARAATVATIRAAPKGHTPCVLATFGQMRAEPALAELAAAAGASHVFLSCSLWGIPTEPLRTQPAELRALAAGDVDWRFAQVATAGREAEAYAVLLQKRFVRRPTGREYRARLDLFALDQHGVDSKHALATGSVDLAELLSGERVDGRLAKQVELHALAAVPRGRRRSSAASTHNDGVVRSSRALAVVHVAFEVAWSPFTTIPHRPSLRHAAARAGGERARLAVQITGDLSRDLLAFLTSMEATGEGPGEGSGNGPGGAEGEAGLRAGGGKGGGGDEGESADASGSGSGRGGGVSRDMAGAALEAVGCRAAPDDVRALIEGLPAFLPAKQLAAALSERREQLYATAQRSVAQRMASASGVHSVDEPIDAETVQATLRALRLQQDVEPPPPAPPSRIRQRTATSHDMLPATSLKTAADIERARGGLLPLGNLPHGEVELNEARYLTHELHKLRGILAEAKPTILRMASG